MEPEDLASFASATAKLKRNPLLIHSSELGFFKEYLVGWGVKLPAPVPAPPQPPVQIDLSDSDDNATEERLQQQAAEPLESQPKENPAADAERRDEAKAEPVAIADSDDEDAERFPEDPEPYLSLPPLSIEEPDEAQVAACAAARQAANEALEAGDVPKALDKYTEAIMTGGASALIYARRGELLLKQRRPCAAIHDCSAAIQVNPDCGKAYRIRGIANRTLGRWEAAHSDLALGQKLDYDEGTVEVQKFVAEKVRRLEERRIAHDQALAQAQARLLGAGANKRRRNK